MVTAKDTTKARLLVSMTLAPGTRIGPFEVLTPLGAGGGGRGRCGDFGLAKLSPPKDGGKSSRRQERGLS